VSYLCQQIRHDDRFASAGHTEQYAVLRSASEPRFDSYEIASCPVVGRLKFGDGRISVAFPTSAIPRRRPSELPCIPQELDELQMIRALLKR
jgi:hypothetical protein